MGWCKDTITFKAAEIWQSNLQYKMEVVYTTAESKAGVFTYSNEELRLRIVDYGKTVMDYNNKERFIIPNNITIKVSDFNGELSKRLMVDQLDYLKLFVSVDGVEKYEYKMLDSPVTVDDNNKTVTLDFATSIDELRTIMVVDKDGNYTNPIDFSDVTIWNPEHTLQLAKVTDVIRKVYAKINTDVTLTIYHDWKFKGEKTSSGLLLEDGTFEELYIEPNKIYIGAKSLKDTLMLMTERFFAKTGMTSNKKAFFKKMYGATTKQVLDVKGRVREVANDRIKYLVAKDSNGDIQLELGTYTIAEEKVEDVRWNWESGWFKIIRNNNTYDVNYAKDESLNDTFYSFTELSYRLLYEKRKTLEGNREDKITVKGVGVNYTENFDYDGLTYDILSLELDNNAAKTIIKAAVI